MTHPGKLDGIEGGTLTLVRLPGDQYLELHGATTLPVMIEKCRKALNDKRVIPENLGFGRYYYFAHPAKKIIIEDQIWLEPPLQPRLDLILAEMGREIDFCYSAARPAPSQMP